ncbi:polysaccharide export protein [Spirosoma linguale DSM 74]|uniref:Polysaccharide export protein n=2 Tax=Spirosoma TaxID=107 RepID=D2QJM9_SPILD|nr:polysaccharide export protein [Spirosoma linguale DSM 74]
MIFKRLLFLSFFGLMACSTNRKLVYLNDLQGQAQENAQILNNSPIRIQPDDVLSITVSSQNPESTILFNKGILASSSTSPTEPGMVNNALTNKSDKDGYLVDREGYIDFPVLGRVKLSDLTKEEAAQKLTLDISKYLKGPVVSVKLTNFSITVLGEVTRPSTFTITRESVNVLEALGMAGDMTVFGKRENVLVIRHQNGIRMANRIDLTNKAALDTPFFYLHQNDIVYVEPHSKSKTYQTDPSNRYIPLWTTLVSSIALTIISLFR